MKENYERCLAEVLEQEGGYSNDPGDSNERELEIAEIQRRYPDRGYAYCKGEMDKRPYWYAKDLANLLRQSKSRLS